LCADRELKGVKKKKVLPSSISVSEAGRRGGLASSELGKKGQRAMREAEGKGEMKDKKSWIDLVREYFPNISDEDADALLWEYTGFPCFWNIPKDGETPEECCRKQLAALREGK